MKSTIGQLDKVFSQTVTTVLFQEMLVILWNPNLLTPITNPTTDGQIKYNISHMKSRNVIERAFGVLKMRFRCLDSSAGMLMFSPERACRVIISCFILHNITRKVIPAPIAYIKVVVVKKLVVGSQFESSGPLASGYCSTEYSIEIDYIIFSIEKFLWLSN